MSGIVLFDISIQYVHAFVL